MARVFVGLLGVPPTPAGCHTDPLELPLKTLMRHLPRRPSRRLTLAAASIGIIMAAPSVSRAQLQLGQIQGIIKNRETGQPLPGVTVVINGPALQGDQTEVSDRLGRYLITQLPPGDGYTLRFYYNGALYSEIQEPRLAAALFGLWLDPRTSEPEMRRRLLGGD